MSPDPKDSNDSKAPAEKMASVTVIGNPLAKDKVLLFQSGATSNGLRVVPQSLVDFVPKGAFGPTDATSVVRPLTQPGQLVSMVFKDTINVYGTTGKEQKDYQLELLSPVQAPLNNNEYQPISGALAGCSNQLEGSDERAWLYYIWDVNGTPVIGELTLSDGAPIQRPLHPKDFNPSTKLYAVYDKERDTRWVIYQNTSNEITILNANQNSKKYTFTVDTTDSRARPGTPIAAAIVPASEKVPESRIVVYFVGVETAKYLYSANSKLGKELYFETPNEQPTLVEKQNKKGVITTASLTAIVNLEHKVPRVVVFGLTDDRSKEYSFNSFEHPVANITA